MWELAQGQVDSNSPYAYLLLAEYFSESCVLAESQGRPVGFVTGFRRPDEPETQFIWQIVVGPEARGVGLGSRMLDELVDAGLHSVPAARCLEATVTPDNTASQRLFRSFARRRGVDCIEETLFRPEDFPGRAGHHDAEIRFRIGPWDPERRTAAG
jgi:L-2,4-diaminobutyric acid acetyltransferase